MKFLLFFAAALVAVQSLNVEQEWTQFKSTHKKSYKNSLEEQLRLAVFQANLKTIAEHNKNYEQGLVSYKKGINQFADLTKEEFLAKLTLSKATKPAKKATTVFRPPMNAKIVDEIDWEKKGAVLEVKDQGNCGSCWSFSATGALEGQNFLTNNILVSLSEQNLMDCSTAYGNEGCNGGLMESAFDYVRDNGITTEETYPYEAKDGKCRYTKADSVLSIKGYAEIKENDEEDLKAAVATIGPTAVAIDASNLHLYAEGVFIDDECTVEGLNHGVLAVGYGSLDGVDYWLIKNSWGETWGENGYVKMARNRNNQCGIAADASYPTL